MAKKNRVLCLFDDNDLEIVQDLSDVDGEGFNAALRKIIREWARTNSEKPVVTGGNGQANK